MFCQLSCTFARLETRKAKHATINVASVHGCVVSYSSVWLHATQSATSLARSIKIKRRHLFWHLEMKVMFCLCLPWNAWHGIMGDLSLLAGVLCSTQWTHSAPCSLTHTRQSCNAQVVLRLLFCAKAFQAPFQEILSMQWPQKMVLREMGMCLWWVDPSCFCCLFWIE